MSEEQLFEVCGDLFTVPLVLESQYGFYVGRKCYCPAMECYIPGDRVSQYYKTEQEAQNSLVEFSDKDPKELYILGLMRTGGLTREQAEEFVFTF